MSRGPGRERPKAVRDPELVYGVHPVLELIESGARTVERIYLARERASGMGRILRAARLAGVPVTRVPREVLGRKVGPRAVHQGIAAQVSAFQYADAAEVCAAAAARPEGLLVLVDGVADPGNLGAILRTAAAAGVDGVILGTAGTVGLGPVVAKASAGAVERVAVARDSRPGKRLEALKKMGFTVLILDPRGEVTWDEVGLRGRLVVVAGGEGRGVRAGLARLGDRRVAIPLAGRVESLNVAISVGVLLFEAVRQRRGSGTRP